MLAMCGLRQKGTKDNEALLCGVAMFLELAAEGLVEKTMMKG